MGIETHGEGNMVRSVTEYERELVDHLRHQEALDAIGAEGIKRLARRVRIRLHMVGWIMLVCQKLPREHAVIPRAMGIFDRVLANMNDNQAQALSMVHRARFMAIVCVWIAYKMEGNATSIPGARRMTAMLPGPKAKPKDLVVLERMCLHAIDHQCTFPTHFEFLSLYHSVLGGSLEPARLRSHQIAESVFFDTRFLAFRPSTIAISALFIALDAEDPYPLTSTRRMITLFGLTHNGFAQCVSLMSTFAYDAELAPRVVSM